MGHPTPFPFFNIPTPYRVRKILSLIRPRAVSCNAQCNVQKETGGEVIRPQAAHTSEDFQKGSPDEEITKRNKS